MKRDIRMERFYPHPQALVWKALTDGKLLAEWFTENTFQPVVGHEFYFKTAPGPDYDGFLYCRVTLVEPPQRLCYTFKGGWMQSETLVTWTLTAHDGGTHLLLEHTGFTGLSEVALSNILESGWGTALDTLPRVLAESIDDATTIE